MPTRPTVFLVRPSNAAQRDSAYDFLKDRFRLVSSVSPVEGTPLFTLFQKKCPEADAVIWDLASFQKIPGGIKNGIAQVRRFLKAIQAIHSTACVIIVGPQTKACHISTLLRNGVYDYLAPPVSLKLLLTTLNRGLKNKIQAQTLMGSLQKTNQQLLNEKNYFKMWSENLSRIYKINQSLVGYLNVDDLLCSFGESIKGLLPYETLSIFLRGYEEPDRAWIWAREEQTQPQTKKKALLQSLHDETLQLGNMFLASETSFSQTVIDQNGTRMIVPLFVFSEKVGLLRVTRDIRNKEQRPFDDYQARLLSMVTTPLCLTLHNARMYQRINALASTDELTLVLNRRAFMAIFERELKRATRLQTPLALLLIDLDLFKSVNDRFGHLAGDTVLKETAALLKQAVREIDILARYGGEEFVILLTDGQQADALMVAERVRRLIEAHLFKYASECIRLTVSIGVASLASSTAKNAEELFHLADLALYNAKKEGRNRVACAPYDTPRS